MRFRKRQKKTIDIMPESVSSEPLEEREAEQLKEGVKEIKTQVKERPKEKIKQGEKSNGAKNKKKSKGFGLNNMNLSDSVFRKIQNPNFNSKLMVIIFSLMSDGVPMQSRLETMTSAIDKVRNISEVLNSSMQSVKVATEVPKQIKRLLK